MRILAAILLVAIVAGEVSARGGRLRILRGRRTVSQPSQTPATNYQPFPSGMQCGPAGCVQTFSLAPPASASRAVVTPVPPAPVTTPVSQPPKAEEDQPQDPPPPADGAGGEPGWKDAVAELTVRVDSLEQDLEMKTGALQEQIDLQVQKLELKIEQTKKTAGTSKPPAMVRATPAVVVQRATAPARPAMSAAQAECMRKAQVLARGRRLYHPPGQIHGRFEGVGYSSSPHNVPTCTPRYRGARLVGDATVYGNGRYWRVRQWN